MRNAQPQYIVHQGWWVCDEGKCLYDARGVERLRGHYSRCIKHGALLTWRMDSKKTRVEVRKELELD